MQNQDFENEANNPAGDGTDPYIDTDKEQRELRRTWGNRVTTAYRYYKERFDEEGRKYVEAYKHEFGGTIPSRLASDRIDVNLVYQTIKTLLPVLYFKNPKVFIKSLKEKIRKVITEPVEDMEGNVIMQNVSDPMTGQPMIQEFDGQHSALILQSAINENINKAKLKTEGKACIEDALLMPFGAVKLGWGNDQGVASMGEGAPPSIREDVYDDSAYAIRLRPWDVIVDTTDFYHPEWIAIRHLVQPEQLREDTRLNFREQVKGNTKFENPKMAKLHSDDPNRDAMMTEYFEIYVKPCAKYPGGKYFMFTEEVKEGFLFEMEWPVAAKTFPVKLLFFNRDPEGGMPMPPTRYLMDFQKAKVNIRNAEYEYVRRTIPALYFNSGAIKDAEKTAKQLQSGQMPRVITGNQPAAKAFGQVSFPGLSSDLYKLDMNVDTDVARVMGLTSPVALSTNQDQLATGLKIAASGEQVRQQENADCVSDFFQEILEHWVALYKEFAGPENYSLIDGETFPVMWGRDEIQGDFNLEIKPFSMSYEDPIIQRRQWIDLLNILSAPPVQMWLKEQGHEVDVVKICKRILETYDERDIDTFIMDIQGKPEMQVLDALKENEAMSMGDYQAAAVLPEDNHKVHILLHGLVGDIAAPHILAHQQAMMGIQPGGSPGGGNPEGLPVNGVATSQEQMQKPLKPSPQNEKNAASHAAKGDK